MYFHDVKVFKHNIGKNKLGIDLFTCTNDSKQCTDKAEFFKKIKYLR